MANNRLPGMESKTTGKSLNRFALNTFDRYLLSRFFYVFTIAFVATICLYVVIDGFSNVDSFQKSHAGESSLEIALVMGRYYLHQVSLLFDMTAPTISLVAVVTVFALLLRNGELNPILASGVPTYRLSVPLVVGVLGINLLVFANQEIVMPQIAHFLQAGHGKDDSHALPVHPCYDGSLVHIAAESAYLADQKIVDVQVTLPSPEVVTDLATMAANEALFYPETDDRPAGWVLKDVVPDIHSLPLTEHGRTLVRPLQNQRDVFLITDATIDQLCDRTKSFQFLTTRELMGRIRNPTQGVAVLTSQMSHFHNRLLQPFLNVLAVFVVLPIILQKESYGIVLNFAICLLVMGGVTVLGEVAIFVSQSSLLSTELASFVPIIVCGLIATATSEMTRT